MDPIQIRERIFLALREEGIEATYVTGDLPAVRVIPDALGADGDRSVVMDICPAEGSDGRVCLRFLTTVAHDVPEDRYMDACCELNALNTRLELGAYSLFEDGTLVHRYAVYTAPEETLVTVAATMEDILELLDHELALLDDIVA